MRYAILALALLATPARAQTALAVASSAAIAADWSISLDAARRGYYNPATGEWFIETNPLLGKFPSVGQLNTYNVLAIGANLGVGLALPRKYRAVWWSAVAGFETAIVLHQYRIGLRFSTRF